MSARSLPSFVAPALDALDTLSLDAGAHSSPDRGMCVMEAVAFIHRVALPLVQRPAQDE
jgi:hypothetical protein